MSTNTCVIIGNLVRDPELRYGSGSDPLAICRFTVAVNSGYGDKQETSFIPVVVFGKQAENCDRYLAKGRKVAVTGRIKTGSYTNKDGQKVYTTDVIASQVEFLSPQGEMTPRSQTGTPVQAQPQAQATPPAGMEIPEGYAYIADEDVPF